MKLISLFILVLFVSIILLQFYVYYSTASVARMIGLGKVRRCKELKVYLNDSLGSEVSAKIRRLLFLDMMVWVLFFLMAMIWLFGLLFFK